MITSGQKQLAFVIGLYIATVMLVLFLGRSRTVSGGEAMHTTDHVQINECVELISVQDPQNNERYLVAWDKCGATSVAITKKF